MFENNDQARMHVRKSEYDIAYPRNRRFTTFYREHTDTRQEIGSALVEEAVPSCMLHPNCLFLDVWNTIIFLILIYTLSLMPYFISFKEDLSDYFILELLIDGLCFLDMIINFMSAYYDNQGVLITSRKKISMNYFKSWFFPDLIACLPLGLLEGVDPDSNIFIRLLKIPRIYRVLRIGKLFKCIKHYGHRDLWYKIQDFIAMKQSMMRLIKSVLTLLLLIHLMACIWHFTARVDDFNDSTWVIEFGYGDSSEHMRYMASLYWSITTLTSVGYGDISATTNVERIVACSWMLFGLYFLSFTISSLLSSVACTMSKQMSLTNSLAIVDEFSKETCLPSHLRFKIKHAIRYNSKKKGFTISDREDILRELPKSLRYEVAINSHQGAAKKLHFFVDQDPAVTSTIVPLLQPLFVDYKRFVYKESEVASEIFFVVNGQISYEIDGSGFQSTLNGDYFGDIETMIEVPRKTDAVARKKTDLLVLDHSALNAIQLEFIHVWEDMKELANEKSLTMDKAMIETILQRKLNQTNTRLEKYNFMSAVRETFLKLHSSNSENNNDIVQATADLNRKMDLVLNKI